MNMRSRFDYPRHLARRRRGALRQNLAFWRQQWRIRGLV